MNKTTLKLNASLKKEYVMKITRMIITPPEIKGIRAFFNLTIGSIVSKEWKLKEDDNGVFHVKPPCKMYKNKNGKFQNEPLVEVLDSKITETILKIALEEYNFRTGVTNANTTN